MAISLIRNSPYLVVGGWMVLLFNGGDRRGECSSNTIKSIFLGNVSGS